MAGVILRTPVQAFWLIDQADLHVVADRALGQVDQGAEFIEGVGAVWSHLSFHV